MSDLKTAPSSCFPTTQWTLILDVIQQPDNDEAAWHALGEFCGRYRPAICNFFRRRGCSHADAEEYTQEFFLTRIQKRWDIREGFLFKARRSEQGKFRCFLAQVLHCFLIDKWRGKRPEGEPAVFEEGHEPASADAPEQFGRELDRELALDVIRKAAGDSTRSNYLLAHFRGETSQADAAAALGMEENAFKQAYARFRKTFPRNLRKEISRLVNPDPQEVEAEIKYLMSLF